MDAKVLPALIALAAAALLLSGCASAPGTGKKADTNSPCLGMDANSPDYNILCPGSGNGQQTPDDSTDYFCRRGMEKFKMHTKSVSLMNGDFIYEENWISAEGSKAVEKHAFIVESVFEQFNRTFDLDFFEFDLSETAGAYVASSTIHNEVEKSFLGDGYEYFCVNRNENTSQGSSSKIPGMVTYQLQNGQPITYRIFTKGNILPGSPWQKTITVKDGYDCHILRKGAFGFDCITDDCQTSYLYRDPAHTGGSMDAMLIEASDDFDDAELYAMPECIGTSEGIDAELGRYRDPKYEQDIEKIIADYDAAKAKYKDALAATTESILSQAGS